MAGHRPAILYPSLDGEAKVQIRLGMSERSVAVFLSFVALTIVSDAARAQGFFTYHCADKSEFVLAFYEGDRRAHVQLDGKALAMSRRPSLSGPRYVRGNIALIIGKTAVTLKRGKRSTTRSAG